MRKVWHILFLLPYFIVALFIVPVALWIKWWVFRRLGVGMADNFLADTIVMFVAMVLACGLVAFVVVFLFFAFAVLHHLGHVILDRFKPDGSRRSMRWDPANMTRGFPA